MKNENFYHLWI